MQELLFGTWGPQIVAYIQQNPWRVFAMVMVALLAKGLLFRERSSRSDGGDFTGLDCGGDGGDGCGD